MLDDGIHVHTLLNHPEIRMQGKPWTNRNFQNLFERLIFGIVEHIDIFVAVIFVTFFNIGIFVVIVFVLAIVKLIELKVNRSEGGMFAFCNLNNDQH